MMIYHHDVGLHGFLSRTNHVAFFEIRALSAEAIVRG